MKGSLTVQNMHGDVISKLDRLREQLSALAVIREVDIAYNRLYLDDKEIRLNLFINKERFLISTGKDGYEVRKTSHPQKIVVGYEQLGNGSFLDMFSK